MNKSLVRKGLVLGIILLFIGTSVLPSISGNIIENDNNQKIPDDNIKPSTMTDWWPMFHHDAENTGNSSSTAPDTNNVLWEYGTGGTVASSPAVVDGNVFFGSIDGNVYCLDALTGAWIWQYPTGDTVWSSPAVVDGKIFIGSGEMASGASNVYCLDALTGAWIWQYTTSGGVDSSPVVADGKVFFGSHDGNVYCVDALTGAFIWQYTTGGCVFSSPAVAEGKVYFGSKDFNLYCVDASTGAWIWQYTTGSIGVMSSPAVVEGKVFFGASNLPYGTVYCLNALTGAFIWQYMTMGNMVQSSPAVADGKVFVGAFNGNVYCLNALTGAFIWQYTTGGTVLSSPAVADGKVYFGSDDNNIYCLDTDGTWIWQHLTADTVRSSPAIADGKVFIGSSDNFIYCFGTEHDNTPPNEPSNPFPADGAIDVDVDADLSWTCSDPDGDDLVYDVYFEADNPDPNVKVSDDQTETNFDPGTMDIDMTYYWKIVAKDEHGAINIGPVWHFTTEEEENQPPGIPTVSGETNGNAGTEYEYTFNAVDPDGDDVKYYIEWGDGNTEWTSLAVSGTPVVVSHTWAEEDTYTITAKAQDEYGLESDWGTLEVEMPVNQQVVINPLFQMILERFPYAFPILRYLLGL